MMRNTELLNAADISRPFDFMFGGNAWFTIKNSQTGIFYKYHIMQNKKNPSMYIIKVFNQKRYQYAGVFIKTDIGVNFYQGKGFCDKTNPAIKGLFYAMNHGKNILPKPMLMFHHGKCACCGKILTDKDSVERGFGPVCFNRIASIS